MALYVNFFKKNSNDIVMSKSEQNLKTLLLFPRHM